MMQDIASEINKSQRELLFPIIDTIKRKLRLRRCIVGEKLLRDARKWLAPPDPWENHNSARESHYKDTSSWFIHGNAYEEWKSSVSNSHLWIHGKRACLSISCFQLLRRGFLFVAGAGKSILWYISLFKNLSRGSWRLL